MTQRGSQTRSSGRSLSFIVLNIGDGDIE